MDIRHRLERRKMPTTSTARHVKTMVITISELPTEDQNDFGPDDIKAKLQGWDCYETCPSRRFNVIEIREEGSLT